MMNILTETDFYKTDHRRQYPVGTEMVYSNITARSAKLKNIPDSVFQNGTIMFGLQYFCQKKLIEQFDAEFFLCPKEKVIAAYKRRLDNALGKDSVPIDHMEKLHDLGYLPICIKALPEGTLCPIGVPMLVIYNTMPEFFWLTNYLETMISNYTWKSIISATTAYHYNTILSQYAQETGTEEFVKFQGHDFSCRGMSGMEDAALSGAAHLTSFVGTDTIPAIDLLEEYYGANSDKELVGCSVPALEHSTSSLSCCSNEGSISDNEIEFFKRIIMRLYPKGIVSLIADTWDFWDVVTNKALALKDVIMSREGKTVFRPDSGDPVKIICGGYF